MDSSHALVVAASDALRGIGREPRLVATSTDANAALDAGLPAIAIGVTEGSEEQHAWTNDRHSSGGRGAARAGWQP